MLNHSLENTLTAGLEYELLDLAELGRDTDEAVAVKNHFGAPSHSSREFAMAALQRIPLVIVGYDHRDILQVLREQRAGFNTPDVALRPIAVIGLNQEHAQPSLEALADVVLGPRPAADAVRDARATLAALFIRTADIATDHGDRALLLLQYLFSHERNSIDPVVDPRATFAYRYPLAESLLSTSTAQALDVLNDLAEYQLLSSKVEDRLFLCPHCNGYRVPVKELCDKCHSPNLSAQNSIHHFRCGHIGPESDFTSGGRLQCPKCRTQLRHVGVEYNHPGRIFTCHECSHWAAEPLLRAWCADCNRYLPPEQLRHLAIPRFALTGRGVRAARAGRWSPNDTQTLSSDASSSAESGRNSNPERKREVARTVLRIATANQWKVTAYRIEFDASAEAADGHERVDGNDSEINRCVTELLGPQALTAPVNEQSILVLNPGTGRHSASASAALARQLSNATQRPARVSMLKTSAATELLATAS